MSEAKWIANSSIKPKKRLSQNFLIDQNISRKIVRLIQGQLGDNILEVGPGTGVLTDLMLSEQYRVKAIEVDQDLVRILEDRLSKYPQVDLICEDAMNYDYKELTGPLWIFVSNLPYNIGTRLIVKLITEVPVIHRYVIMIQKEVADRMVASAGTKSYGTLSVVSQLFTKPKIQFDVHPNSFIPRPEVVSTVMTLQREELPFEEERLLAFNLAKIAFQQRRKKLKKSLSKQGINFDKFTDIGISENQRAEEITPDEYLLIAKSMNNES